MAKVSVKSEDLPEFDRKGYGILDPFKKYAKKSDEPIDIALVRYRSHRNFTFHLPLPAHFDKNKVLPEDQLRRLR